MAQPSRILVDDYSASTGFAATPDERSRSYAEQLEHGNILMFQHPPFELPRQDCEFLTSHYRAESAIHKNISYHPEEDRLRGFSDGKARQQVHDIMRRYSRAVIGFVQQFLPYERYSLDYASYRPLEEEGRALPLHKRNDLLHVDAFPSRPTRGGRILRVFTNIGSKSRVWITAHTFPDLAAQLAQSAELDRYVGGEQPCFIRYSVWAHEQVSSRTALPTTASCCTSMIG